MKRQAIFIMEINNFSKSAKEKNVEAEFKEEEYQYNFCRRTESSKITLIKVIK